MIEILARATRTANVTSDWIDTDAEAFGEVAVFMEVFGAPGGISPTIRLIVEESPDKSTIEPLGQSPQVSAAGVERLRFTEFARYVRVRLEVGGTTPSFDCKVVADTD